MYFGIVTLVERLSLVIVGGATALVLGVGCFVAGAWPQSPRTVLALRVGIPSLALICLLVFLVAMRFYPLGSERVQEIHRQLAERRAARTGGSPA